MKSSKKSLHKAITLALFGSLSATTAPAVFAQQGVDDELEEVVIIGSRGAPRTALESMVPVDVFGADEMINKGQVDMNDMLRDLIPSYNVQEQQISDTNSLVRPATLRNLPADNALVLVNGKRRHRSAGLQFGNTGIHFPDVQYIPPIAMRQVEVLRDNAGAQYGSDAIAGVLNFQLAEDREGFTIDTRYGFHNGDIAPPATPGDNLPGSTTGAPTRDRDGHTFQTQARLALPVGDEGSLNISGLFVNQNRTDRAIQRGDATAVREAGNTNVKPKVMDRGQPDEERFSIFANLVLPLSNGSEFYSFGNFGKRDTRIGFFFRNPENTGGIFTRDNEEGEQIQLFMDLSDEADPLNNCPQIPTGVDPATGVTSSILAAEFARNSDQCFSFLEQFPGGYTPYFGSTNTDFSGAMGLRGDLELMGGTQYDLSWYFGFNEMTFELYNTTSPSFGPESQNFFEPGIYTVFENTATADFVTPVDIGMASPLNVAYGLEWRRETFEVRNEDAQAWQIGPFADQGAIVGANGFPGFSPIQQGTFNRSNWAGYVDFQLSPVERLDLGLAGRWENFYDIEVGDEFDVKASARYQLTDVFAVRGSAGTGIRVASPGQANVTFVRTAIIDGVPTNAGQIPPTNPIAQLFGGQPLEPESSESLALGVTASFPFGLDLTIDAFRIEIDDRITNSGDVEIDAATAQAIEETGVTGAGDIAQFSFFTNAIDSRTEGIEAVATYPLEWNRFGTTDLSLSYTFKNEEIQRVDFQPADTPGEFTDDPIVTRAEQLELERRQPDHRMNFNLTHNWQDIRLNLAARYFGTIIDADNDGPEFDTKVGAEWIVDAELGYTFFNNQLEAVIGAENLFDAKADRLTANQGGTSSFNSSFYNTHVIGTDGRFLYTRLRYDF